MKHEPVTGDVRNLESVRTGMSGCDAVIHLASLSNWRDIDSPLMDAVVIDGTRNVLAAAHAEGARRMVYVSSSLAVNGTRTPVVQDEDAACELRVERYRYTRAKRAAEDACREAARGGLPVVIVNPGEVYGPNDVERITADNLVDFAKSSPVLVCDGGTAVVHVEDVASGILAALDRGHPGERYILAGENLSVHELATLALGILGQRKRVLQPPNASIGALAWAGRTLRLPLPFNPYVIPYATKYWFMNGGKAERELGVTFRPAREVLEPTLHWLAASGALD